MKKKILSKYKRLQKQLQKKVGRRKRYLIAGLKDLRNVIKKRWDKFYKNYFHGFLVAVFFLSTVFGVVSFQTIRTTSRQLRETQEQKQEIHLQLEQSSQELQKLIEDKNATQEQLDTKKSEYDALQKRYKALEQAKANRPTAIYAAAQPTISGSHQDWLSAAGIPSSVWGCAEALIQRESGWRVNAYNPSGAYGLPQSLPGSKMASHGDDWATNPVTQLKWMNDYVNGRYGGWCQADGFQRSHNWY